MKDQVMVSIVCATYNHEKYIEDAIESFLMQQTSFKYEIIIHDDASTDNTTNIIKRYSEKYPDLIHTIIQEENQYSKKISYIEKYMVPMAKGKYIAICEGDDYWTDSCKLQKQVEILEKHPECDICAHTASNVDAKSKNELGKIMPSKEDILFDVKDVILGDGGFVATNSIMFRKKIFDAPPDFWNVYKLDYSIQIMGSLRGGMLYLADCMSAYRICAKGSWTNRMMNNKVLFVEHFKSMIKMLESLDSCTNGNYKNEIDDRIRWQKVQILILQNNYKKIAESYKDVIKKMGILERIMIYMEAFCPWILKIYRWGVKHVRKK